MPLTKATQNVVEGIVSTGSTGVSAGSFILGQQYKITSLGTTTQSQWNTIAGTTGQTYVVGSLFTAATTGASSGNGAAAVARTLANRFADVVNVLDFGADNTGATDCVSAINDAITFAKSKGGSVILFPAGTYKLTATSLYNGFTCHFPIEDADGLDFVGYGAILSSTPAGGGGILGDAVSLFHLNGCRRINFEGFDITGIFSRTLSVVNTYSISCFDLSSTLRDSESISVKNCRLQNVYLALRVIRNDANSYRVRNIYFENVFCTNGYYGLNCQENGDNLTAVNFRTNGFIRSYFPYGVTNHNISYTSYNGDIFTDCLIKAYKNDTTNINVKAVIIGNTSPDYHVAIETQNNPSTQPIPAKLQNIVVNIDDTQCASGSSSLRIGYFQDPGGTVTSTSPYQLFDNITIRGEFRSSIVYAVTQSTGVGAAKGLINTQNLNYTPVSNPTTFGFYTKVSDYVGGNSSADFVVGFPNTAAKASEFDGSINFNDFSGTPRGYFDGTYGLSTFKFYGINPFEFETNASTAGALTHEFIGTGVGQGVKIYEGANTGSPNAANAVVKIGQMNITSRSLNAAGTLNASGADYAEYEYNDGLVIEKGSIVGFKANGKLTVTFDEAIRFAIKSTNPSFVGGDVWGSDEVAPQKPARIVEEKEVVKVSDEIYDGEVCIQPAKYEEVIKVKGDTDEEWDAKESNFNKLFAEFEEKLELKRKQVDRIAYSGKVPVNVTGAIAGGYIIADKDEDGKIIGKFVSNPTFEEYKLAVGRVNKILEDGRPEVAIIIH
jgi:hypothetical protein